MNEPHEPKLMDFLTRPVETLEALDQQESGKNDDPAKHQEPESEASHRPDPLRIMGTTLDVPMAGTARQSVESPPTVVANGRSISVAAGSGIVADSDPFAELEETRAKAMGVLLALAA